MLSINLKINLLKPHLKNLFIQNNKFKSNKIKDINNNLVQKKIDSGYISYGIDSDFGSYFIYIDKEKEGFIWFKNLDRDTQNSLFSIEDIISTKKYKDIKDIHEKYFLNLNTRSIATIEKLSDFELNFDNFIKTIISLNFNSNKNKSTKILIKGLILLNLFMSEKDLFDNSIEQLNENQKELLFDSVNQYSNIKDLLIYETLIDPYKYNINFIIYMFLNANKNIFKINKEKISIINIIRYLKINFGV